MQGKTCSSAAGSHIEVGLSGIGQRIPVADVDFTLTTMDGVE
jgi:hypothetical protein